MTECMTTTISRPGRGTRRLLAAADVIALPLLAAAPAAQAADRFAYIATGVQTVAPVDTVTNVAGVERGEVVNALCPNSSRPASPLRPKQPR